MKTKTPPARTQVNERKKEGRRANGARLRRPQKTVANLLNDPDPDLPPLPAADAQGYYPAIETARVVIARQVIRARKAAGWTQPNSPLAPASARRRSAALRPASTRPVLA